MSHLKVFWIAATGSCCGPPYWLWPLTEEMSYQRHHPSYLVDSAFESWAAWHCCPWTCRTGYSSCGPSPLFATSFSGHWKSQYCRASDSQQCHSIIVAVTSVVSQRIKLWQAQCSLCYQSSRLSSIQFTMSYSSSLQRKRVAPCPGAYQIDCWWLTPPIARLACSCC